MLNIRIIPFTISIKSFNRSFHISSINYNKISDLKAGIDALKETSTKRSAQNTNNLNDHNIMLTDKQASKLSDLDGIIKLNKQINQAKSGIISSTDFNNKLESKTLPYPPEEEKESANLRSGCMSYGTVSFLGVKFNLVKWLLLIFIVGAYCFTKTYVIPAYKIEYPESYNYITAQCAEVIYNYGLYILLNSLFLWCFGLCIFYAIEIYIFLIYSIKKEGINLPKYLPKLTKIWLKRLEENSKSEYKEAYVHIYGRTLLIHLLVVLIIVFIKFWFII